MIDETPARVSLGAGMTKTEQFFDQSGIALAALGSGKVQKLPHGEVAGMRRHKVEEPCFHFGIAEVKEPGELVFCDIHGLEAQDCCTQFPVVADTAKAVGLAMPGIDLKAGASLLGEPGIKLLLHLVVELDSQYFTAATFDLIADLVIKPVEVGVVKSFFGFPHSMVGGLVGREHLAAREEFVAFLG